VDVKEPNKRAKGCKDAEIKVGLFSFIGTKWKTLARFSDNKTNLARLTWAMRQRQIATLKA
jgi:hypothetical protein